MSFSCWEHQDRAQNSGWDGPGHGELGKPWNIKRRHHLGGKVREQAEVDGSFSSRPLTTLDKAFPA